jgi:predicted ATPase
MNRAYEVLNTSLKRIESQLAKQGGTDIATVKALIKSELKKQKGGISKEELLTFLEDIFGKSNLINGKYKGGQEAAREVITEIFGKENIKNSKFTGG